jgi:uroporphyrinogen-III synthase
VLSAADLPVALIAEVHLAEALVDAFPPGPGTVLVAQADRARPVVVDGLRAKGWQVEAVVAYRTVTATVTPSLVAAVMAADAVTFTSASTVEGYCEAFAVVSPVVVCIGPITAAAAEQRGLRVDAVAAQHTVEGLVSATIAALGEPDR